MSDNQVQQAEIKAADKKQHAQADKEILCKKDKQLQHCYL